MLALFFLECRDSSFQSLDTLGYVQIRAALRFRLRLICLEQHFEIALQRSQHAELFSRTFF